MRCSTMTMYQQSMNGMSRAMAEASHTRNQLAEGQTLIVPSDDPVNATQALLFEHASLGIEQHRAARQHASDTLGYEDNALSSIGGLLTENLAEKIVAAGNGTYSLESRQAVATELQAIRDSLVNLANSKNGQGRYIFSGYKTSTPPFSSAGEYLGGDRPVKQWVSDSMEMQVSHLGCDIFISEEHGNLFTRLDETIAALKKSDTDGTLPDVLQRANQTIKQCLSNLGSIQTRVGTNLQMIDRLNRIAGDNTVLIQERYQNSVGSDNDTMVRLISDVAVTETALQSSMLLFKSMKNISLFNMI